MLNRREVVRELLVDRGELLVVSGLGSSTYDVAAAGEHALNVYLWGGMGGTAMIGLGLALARPDRRVAVITGDGEMLMGLGAFATIGVKQPRNLSIVVLDNGHYGETGMQKSHTSSGIDLVGVAQACGFAHALTLSSMSDVREARQLMHSAVGPSIIRAPITIEDMPRVLPTRDGHAIRVRLAAALSGN